MIELIFLAIALSMDAFAVSIGLGVQHKAQRIRVALLSGFYFGLFQGLMPVVGYWGGKGLLEWADLFAPWIAFALLTLIGGKMVSQSYQSHESVIVKELSHRTMIILAIATSIDALAAGFTLNLLGLNVLVACFIIGLTTLLFSVVGVYVGNKSGTLLENKAELFGGIILILLGFKILLF